MKTIYFGILGCALLVACDGNDDPKDATTNPTVATDASSGGDSTQTNDVTSNTSQEVDVGQVEPGTVKALQAEAGLVDCVADAVNGFVEVNPIASVSGAVVVSAKFNANGDAAAAGLDGYYIADAAGGPYSGIKVTVERTGAFDATTGFQIGETVDVAGQLQEFFCLTQLKANTITSTGTGTAPSPVAIGAADIGEAFESVLVKLSGVTIEAASAQGGFKIAGTDIGIGFGIRVGTVNLVVGGKYDITGVVGFAFDKFQLLPRGPADVTVVELPQTDTVAITTIQDSAISKTCATPNPNFVNGLDVSIEGVVIAGNFSNGSSIIVSDGTQNPYSGVLVYAQGGLPALVVGDNVKVAGSHVEFYCLTELSKSTVTKTEGTLAVPAPVVLQNTISDADLEQYEGMLVQFNNVSITGDDGHGAATTSGTFLIDKTINAAFTVPASGTTLTSVTGIVTYSFNKYRVAPRSAADVVAAP